MTTERTKPKTLRRKIERWIVGVVMAIIAFVLEKIVVRSVRRAGEKGATEEVHTTLTSKGGEVDLDEVR